MIVLRRRIAVFVVGALLYAFGLGATGAGALGCGSSQPKTPSPPPPKPLHLTFVSATDTNGGTALHVLVRKTNRIDYPRQDYDDVAKSLLLESDPDTLEWVVVTPDTTREVVVARPADAQVGVYFLFTAPGARWRHLVDDESVEYVEFEVGRDQIEEAANLAPASQAPAPSRKKGR
jgi:predicted component of type VI protein secretion system